ncbi:MAG: hypothetical protein IJ716_10045 [Lachnospiraceae bacterium]|nr:hypothetical protein [Lachnospiraceae bacterium]
MDTFMEKLAEKFTAQEMIKANEVAERQEAERFKTQVQEYTECLDRMKQICAEIEQTADSAKNKVESVQIDTDGLKEELLKMWEDMQAATAEKAGIAENVKEEADEQAEAAAERLAAQMTELRSVMQQQIDGLQNTLDARLAQLAQKADENPGLQMEDVKGLQAEQLNLIRSLQQDQLDNLRSVLKAQISGLKEGQNQSDFILSELESQRNMLDAKIAEIKTGVEEQLGGSNEFVHRECVKVYRNVQAVIGDENKKQTENLDYTFNPMKNNLNKIFKISVVALVASVAGVVLQILSMLHIL